MRLALSRVVVVVSLVLALPGISVAERLRRGCGRRIARRCIRVVTSMCGVRFDVVGFERLDGQASMVVVPNHSSPLDIPALLMADPDIRFMAAAELFRVPVLASAMRALGTVPIDRRHGRRGHEQIDALAHRGGRLHLAIFAEGAIAPHRSRLPFKNGAFDLAIATGAAIIPVAIHGSAEVLAPHGRLRVRPGVVTIEFGTPLRAIGDSLTERDRLRDDARAAVIATLVAGPPSDVAVARAR